MNKRTPGSMSRYYDADITELLDTNDQLKARIAQLEAPSNNVVGDAPNVGAWEFVCEMCGGNVDEDHAYCIECDEHAGQWLYLDSEGLEIVAPAGERRPG